MHKKSIIFIVDDSMYRTLMHWKRTAQNKGYFETYFDSFDAEAGNNYDCRRRRLLYDIISSISSISDGPLPLCAFSRRQRRLPN